MSSSQPAPDTPRRATRKPRVTVDGAIIDRLEALASGALSRNPDLADQLLGEISRAHVTKPGKLPTDVVSIGNLVTYLDEETEREHQITLVFPEDADIALNRVSVLTPIGTGLIGLNVGARIRWQMRDGTLRDLSVISVEPGTGTEPGGAEAV